jgi:hypothetical protein
MKSTNHGSYRTYFIKFVHSNILAASSCILSDNVSNISLADSDKEDKNSDYLIDK